jgi:hypothetical protein
MNNIKRRNIETGVIDWVGEDQVREELLRFANEPQLGVEERTANEIDDEIDYAISNIRDGSSKDDEGGETATDRYVFYK